VESILDKLVSASVSSQSQSAEPPTTRKVAAAETSKPDADEQVLNQLTTAAETVRPSAVEQPQPVAADNPVKQDQSPLGPVGPREDILEELTGRGKGQGDAETEQTDGPEAGDSSDA